MKLILGVFVLVMIVSCNEEYPDANINKVRSAINLNWLQWRPIAGETHSIVQNKGAILEGEGSQVCHYIYPEVAYDYTLTSSTYQVSRILQDYTLGKKTTASPEYCHSRASMMVNEKVQDDFKIAYALLYLDKLPANTTLPLGNITVNNFKAIPTKIISDTRFINDKEIGVHTLSYNVEGIVNQETKISGSSTFKGTCEIIFATDVIPGAYVLSVKAEGLVDGVTHSESYQNVVIFNGVVL